MELQLKATDQIATCEGTHCRVWEGVTERGVRCNVFVHHLAVQNNHDCNQLEQELHECLPIGRFIPIREAA